MCRRVSRDNSSFVEIGLSAVDIIDLSNVKSLLPCGAITMGITVNSVFSRIKSKAALVIMINNTKYLFFKLVRLVNDMEIKNGRV